MPKFAARLAEAGLFRRFSTCRPAIGARASGGLPP